MIDHPTNSSDWAEKNLYMLSKVTSALTGFQTIEAVKKKNSSTINAHTEFQHYFENRKFRMDRCRNRRGLYLEGDNDKICMNLK